MQSLREDMTMLVQRTEAVFKEFTHRDDAHLSVCTRMADEFELWEPASNGDGEAFPTWLSYVVQGIGRDAGILD